MMSRGACLFPQKNVEMIDAGQDSCLAFFFWVWRHQQREFLEWDSVKQGFIYEMIISMQKAFIS